MSDRAGGVVTKAGPWSVELSYPAPAALGARYGLGDELAARLAGIDAVTGAAVAASSAA
jgi:hypothetical protein